ncbi:MAG: hypothetical protein AB8B71_11155 [Paracoccaceae bacterium]
MATLALFLLGVLAARNVVDNAPAFQDDLNITSITGASRIRHTPSMYDRGSYLFQIGYGYLNADVLSFGGIEGPTELATMQVAFDRLEKARVYLEESIRLNPSDAHAWQAYAQALGGTGYLEESRQALEKSWNLAPSHKQLALSRIHMIEAIRALVEDPQAHSDIYLSDIAVLERNAPRFLKSVDQSL